MTDKPSHTAPNKLDVFGDGMLTGLQGQTRTRRKREASKKRRVLLRQQDKQNEEQPERPSP
jgi:hypothetical protein